MIANPNDGNSPRVEVATPMIDVSAGGLITATTEQEKGYVSGGTKSATQQLTTQGAKTVTPGTTAQTAVASGRYTTGAVQVAGDANLVPENIAEGVSIFGVTGAHSGGGGTSTVSFASAGNSDIDFVYYTANNQATQTGRNPASIVCSRYSMIFMYVSPASPFQSEPASIQSITGANVLKTIAGFNDDYYFLIFVQDSVASITVN